MNFEESIDYGRKRQNDGTLEHDAEMKRTTPDYLDTPAEDKPAGIELEVTSSMVSGNNVVEIVQVPEQAVGLVIGRGGEQVGQIQASSGARVQMAPEGLGDGMRSCSIQGDSQAVERAKQMIIDVIGRHGDRIHTQPKGSSQITEDMLIPADKCGLIIGKQGDTIRQLQERTGIRMALVQNEQTNQGQPKPLRMTGTPTKVAAAKQLIESMLVGGPDGMLLKTRIVEATARGEVVVPRSAVGMIIGRSGETIRRIAQETGARIQFQPDVNPASGERTAVLVGTMENIERATQAITQLVNRSFAQSGDQGPELFYMHVPASKTGQLIGKGGETIKQISAESGAHCQLSNDPPPKDDEKVFTIKGTPYQVHHAKHLIRIRANYSRPTTNYGVPQMAAVNNGAPVANWNLGCQQPQAAMSMGNVGWQQQMQPFYGQPAQYVTAPAPYNTPSMVQQQPQVAPMQQQQPGTIYNQASGQPDYSAQWIQYYRQMGMHDQAAAVENQLKALRATQPQ
ncbi:unnamed protein product, partial [Mesorhabditis spiculigera]